VLKVSVIIPAYNAEGFLERAVRSALTQTERDLEVIVIDDGSIDHTVDVALRIAEQDDRVRVLQNGENCGVSLSRNRAIDLASGEWIAVLDADDTWLPQRIEALLLVSGDCDVVCDDLLFVEKPGSDPSSEEPSSLCAWIGFRPRVPHWLTLAELLRHDLGLLKPVIRREFLDDHKLRYDVDLRVTEDYYLYFNLLAAGARWKQLSEGYYIYSRHTDSLTSSPDAVIRQHLMSSRALLAHPAVRADRAVLAAMKRHHRQSRASIAKHRILELARRRQFLAIGNLLLQNRDYAPLMIWKASRHMYMRAARRARILVA
jgi:glycosyltransferase involved in cell wall biosynthesis